MQGLSDLVQAFAQLKKQASGAPARKVTAAGAAVVKKAIKQRAAQQPTLADAPFVREGKVVQPGAIARAVVSKYIADSGAASQHIVAIASNPGNGHIGQVAKYLEFGTVKMPPKPFVRPAVQASAGAAVAAMQAALEANFKGLA